MHNTAQAKLFRDRTGLDEWRVERIDDDGACEVAIFAGPGARDRARRFADREYGDFEEIPDGAPITQATRC